MKIAVCVKHVPVGQLRMQPDTQRLDRNGPGELNAADKNAIEESLRLKAEADAEVVIVSVGPDAATESMRTALAMGADRAVLVCDGAAEGSDLIATSKLLAAVLGREAADLVLFGQQTSDGGGAVLWAAVAEHLRLPFVSQTAELTVVDGAVRVGRETEFGDDVIEVDLPALVAVSDTINEPRYTSLKGMMGAKKKPLEVLSVADLGLDASEAGTAGSRTEVLGVAPPPPRVDAIRVEDDDDNAAQAVFDFLVERQLA
jgi:electron transfer flavoprotein beta subunit